MVKRATYKLNGTHTLNTLIDNAFDTKEHLKTYKKEESKLVGEIKKRMTEADIKNHVTSRAEASISTVEKFSFDDDKLMDLVKSLTDKKLISKLIRTKEYVDMDALENAIYHGDLSAGDLEPAQIKTETVRLSIKKVK